MSRTPRWVFRVVRRRGGVLGTEPTSGGTGAADDAATEAPETEVALLSAELGEEGVVVVAAPDAG